MLKYLILVSIFMLSSIGAVAGGDYSYSDFTEDQIETLKGIAGEYINSRGDSFGVIFQDKETSGNDQGDLFEELNKEFYFTVESDTVYDFTLHSVEFSADEFVLFTDSENECDSPGCETYEATLSFQKNRKGMFYVSMKAEVIADAEDISVIYEENMDMEEEELEELLDMECKASYGSNAGLYSYVDDYKNSVYCEYEVNIFMKKVSEKKD